MVRRAQMQKQMDISSTKADKLLKKAETMNNRMFEKGGVNMTEKGEDPFKGDKPTGKTDKRGHPQYEREDGTKYYRLFGGDDVKQQQKPQKQQEPMKRNMGGTAISNDAKKSRGAGAMIRGLIFRGVF